MSQMENSYKTLTDKDGKNPVIVSSIPEYHINNVFENLNGVIFQIDRVYFKITEVDKINKKFTCDVINRVK